MGLRLVGTGGDGGGAAAAPAPESRSVPGEELWWPPRELAGVTVTADTALTFSAFFAAVNVLSTDTSTLPLRVWRRRPDGGRDLQQGHAVDDLLNVEADDETGAGAFRQTMMGGVCGWGNGLAEVVRTGRGRAARLHLLDVATTRPKRNASGALAYDGPTLKRPLEPSNVLHFSGLSPDGIWGYSPVRLHKQGIGLGLASQAFGATFFGNGTTFAGHFETDKVLKTEARKHFKQSVNREHQGPYNAHKNLLLEDGIKWVKDAVEPETAQFLATRAFEVIEIARIFRLPPHKLGDYSQAHLANIEASNLDYLMTSLMPWLVMIERESNRKLFTRQERNAGFFVEHDFDYVLRADSKARGDFYNRLFGLSVLTANDVARREQVNPIGPDGDRRYVSVNFQTVENAVRGKSAPAPAKGQPADDDQADDDGGDDES